MKNSDAQSSATHTSTEKFRALSRSSWLSWGVFFVPVGVILAIMAVVWKIPWLFIPAIFLGIVGFAERKTTTRIRKALEAREKGPGEIVSARIEVTRWSDDDRYWVTLAKQDGSRWKFECMPAEDLPSSGSYEAEMWSDELGVPLVAVISDVLLIPRRDPTQNVE